MEDRTVICWDKDDIDSLGISDGTYNPTITADDGTYDSAAKQYMGDLIVDTTAPAWPAGAAITATNRTNSSVDISWDASTDANDIQYYKVYKDNVLQATLAGDVTTYAATQLTAGTSNTFKIVSVDKAGNTSDGPSAAVDTAARLA